VEGVSKEQQCIVTRRKTIVLRGANSYEAWTIFNAISFDAERSNIRSGQEALVFAIFYAAVTCATPEECTKQFHEDRTTLVKRYEKAAQAALTNADYINSNELVSLQAFIIYLVSL
jgi:hypothetical protein